MIDIHTHILPGIDDGAKDMADALAMARVAVADGIATVVATPHSGDETSVQVVDQRVAALQAALDDADIPLRVLTGVEVWLSPAVAAERESGLAFSINGGPYMLVELPLQSFPTYTEQTIFSLQIAGVKPVLAHPERCAGLDGDLEPLYRLVSRGVLAQLSAGSLLGAFGPRIKAIAEQMLCRGLVHLIASDAHSARARPPALSGAAERAAELVGKQRARAMVSLVPRQVIAGEEVDLPEPETMPSKRRWFPWRR